MDNKNDTQINPISPSTPANPPPQDIQPNPPQDLANPVEQVATSEPILTPEEKEVETAKPETEPAPVDLTQPKIDEPIVTTESVETIKEEIPEVKPEPTPTEVDQSPLPPKPPKPEDQPISSTILNSDTLSQPDKPEPTLEDFGIEPKPGRKSGSITKVLFIFSVIIFILVATAFAFLYLKTQSTTDSSSSTSSTSPTATSVPSGSCYLNDVVYQVGESFVAADGCNTCICESNDTITCTNMECLSTTSSSSSAETITSTEATTSSETETTTEN